VWSSIAKPFTLPLLAERIAALMDDTIEASATER
jgi:hypothetical protein